ncbi:hypothetical protein [Hespellia stercorisuis]|uniref:hypothetical protein n=1 Tax=Hespellia stercorisuis TaxID=180311 RepID=UPI00093315E4|nr:hypothetical protein [Hespellia stercorisuis]
MSLEEKWKNDRLIFVRITNADMVCKDCTYRFDCEIMCLLYEIKPDEVLGGGQCDFYEKGESL